MMGAQMPRALATAHQHVRQGSRDLAVHEEARTSQSRLFRLPLLLGLQLCNCRHLFRRGRGAARPAEMAATSMIDSIAAGSRLSFPPDAAIPGANTRGARGSLLARSSRLGAGKRANWRAPGDIFWCMGRSEARAMLTSNLLRSRRSAPPVRAAARSANIPPSADLAQRPPFGGTHTSKLKAHNFVSL